MVERLRGKCSEEAKISTAIVSTSPHSRSSRMDPIRGGGYPRSAVAPASISPTKSQSGPRAKRTRNRRNSTCRLCACSWVSECAPLRLCTEIGSPQLLQYHAPSCGKNQRHVPQAVHVEILAAHKYE